MNKLLSRDLSSYPVSVGTGLALETLFNPEESKVDPSRVIPKLSKPVKAYGVFALSINTLINNVIQATHDVTDLSDTTYIHLQIADIVEAEVNVITDITKDVYPHLQVTAYLNTLIGLNVLLDKNDAVRIPGGKVNGHAFKLYKGALKQIILRDLYPIYRKRSLLSSIRPGSRVLALTSLPLDFVGNERALTLLEPHTGKAKEFHEFYTKFYPIPKTDLSHIPFNQVSLSILGDKHNIKPAKMSVRKELVDLSISNRWLYSTTANRMIDDIRSSSYETLKDLTKIYENF